ncbi:MAG: hypothetical protein ACREQR_11540 [Candidatus Binataceae bacterium]
MRQLFSKADLRAISATLALVMLLGSVPLAAGVVIVSNPGRVELTANICQPIQMFDRVSSTLIARPAISSPEFVLFLVGLVAAKPIVPIVECKAAPEIPPPERLS